MRGPEIPRVLVHAVTGRIEAGHERAVGRKRLRHRGVRLTEARAAAGKRVECGSVHADRGSGPIASARVVSSVTRRIEGRLAVVAAAGCCCGRLPRNSQRAERRLRVPQPHGSGFVKARPAKITSGCAAAAVDVRGCEGADASGGAVRRRDALEDERDDAIATGAEESEHIRGGRARAFHQIAAQRGARA